MFFDSSAFLFQGTVNQINSSVYTGNGLQLFALVEYAFPVFFYLHCDDSTLFLIENALHGNLADRLFRAVFRFIGETLIYGSCGGTGAFVPESHAVKIIYMHTAFG